MRRGKVHRKHDHILICHHCIQKTEHITSHGNCIQKTAHITSHGNQGPWETASGVRDTADTVAARGAHALTETSRNQTKLSESTWSELWEPV